MNTQKNWFVRHWIITTCLVIFVGIPILSGVFTARDEGKKVATIAKSTEIVANTQAIYNISGLASSTIMDIENKLGKPDSKYVPLTKAKGDNPSYTYKKNDEYLEITYDTKTKKVIDFFIASKEGKNNIDKDDDKINILSKLGVILNGGEYKVANTKLNLKKD